MDIFHNQINIIRAILKFYDPKLFIENLNKLKNKKNLNHIDDEI